MAGEAHDRARPKRRSSVRFHGTQGAAALTLAQLREAKIWFAGKGKIAWQHELRGRVHGFRHSLKSADGGLQVARFGGDGWWDRPDGRRVPITVYPWTDLPDLESRIAGYNARRRNAVEIQPCMALSGTSDIPHPNDVMVIDLDYSPSEDLDVIGAAFRDGLAETLMIAGVPLFGSSSGNGWHALIREDADFLREARENGTEVRFPRDAEEKIGGAAAELFPAGAKRHVVVRWEKARANAALDTPIPMVSREWLREALESARARAEGSKERRAPGMWEGWIEDAPMFPRDPQTVEETSALEPAMAANANEQEGGPEGTQDPERQTEPEYGGDWYPPEGWDAYYDIPEPAPDKGLSGRRT